MCASNVILEGTKFSKLKKFNYIRLDKVDEEKNA